jgi:hypothetical protein
MTIRSPGRLVIRRSKESRTLRKAGLIVNALLFIASFILFYIDSEVWLELFLWAILLLPVSFISIRELFRRVILHEEYISFTTWYGVPRVYGYEEIIGVETVKADNEWILWSEDYVNVCFSDNSSLRVLNSLISARKFRKLLAERSGRRYRKPVQNR